METARLPISGVDRHLAEALFGTRLQQLAAHPDPFVLNAWAEQIAWLEASIVARANFSRVLHAELGDMLQQGRKYRRVAATIAAITAGVGVASGFLTGEAAAPAAAVLVGGAAEATNAVWVSDYSRRSRSLANRSQQNEAKRMSLRNDLFRELHLPSRSNSQVKQVLNEIGTRVTGRETKIVLELFGPRASAQIAMTLDGDTMTYRVPELFDAGIGTLAVAELHGRLHLPSTHLPLTGVQRDLGRTVGQGFNHIAREVALPLQDQLQSAPPSLSLA